VARQGDFAATTWPIRYGRGEVLLQIPERNVGAFHRPGAARAGGSGGSGRASALLESALDAVSPSLADALAGRTVTLLTSDATREEPRGPVLAASAGILSGARSVRIAVATGSHDPRAPSTLALAEGTRRALVGAGAPVEDLLIHDAASGPFREYGFTSRGTPIRLNSAAMDAEAFFVLSDMKPHYFAGYSCPPKFVFPGLAALGSIEANHALTLDPASRTGRHPWHPDRSRGDNPLAEDYCEAYERAVGERPSFALTFGSSGGEILWAEAGTLRQAASRGMLRADEVGGVVTPPARFAVVSPGGWPNDIDLYIGQRALELTGAAFAEGGEVLFLCACEEGIGPAHSLDAFWEPLHGDLAAIAGGAPGPYRLYAHKAIRFARMMMRLRALHLHSGLPAAEVAGAHLIPAPDPQAVIDRWLGEDGEARILLFDGASKLSVVAP